MHTKLLFDNQPKSNKKTYYSYLRCLSFFVFAMLFASCNFSNKKEKSYFIQHSLSPKDRIATGFLIEDKKNHKLLTINAKNEQLQFILYKTQKPKLNNKDASFIKIPLQNMVCLSATQIAAADKLGILDKIVGVSEVKYMKHTEILKKIDAEDIQEVMFGGEIKIETLITLNPDVILNSSAYQNHLNMKYDLLTIPYLDYLEQTALGRAEWLKVLGALFDIENKANTVFDSIVKQYREIIKTVSTSKIKPSIISGKAYGETWWVPGGKSYLSTLFTDSGCEYLWNKNEKTGSIALDFESVYHKGLNADFWLIIIHSKEDYSYRQLLSENPLYKNMKAFREKKIIYCNTAKTNYFEEGSLEPQIILADLIIATHPKLQINHKPKYFKILEDVK